MGTSRLGRTSIKMTKQGDEIRELFQASLGDNNGFEALLR